MFTTRVLNQEMQDEEDLQYPLCFWDGDLETAEREKEQLIAQLDAFATIGLAEMNSVALLDRVEVKYLFHINRLAHFLAELQGSYAVLTVEGQRLNRYRTSAISTREMTYLFILIALPVMNSVLIASGNWAGMLVANGLVVTVLYVLEQGWGFHYEGVATVRYDRIELIQPANHHLLYEDLRHRTGLPIKRFEIGRINFVEDTVELTLYYDEAQAGKAKVQEQPHNFNVSYAQTGYLPTESK